MYVTYADLEKIRICIILISLPYWLNLTLPKLHQSFSYPFLR